MNVVSLHPQTEDFPRLLADIGGTNARFALELRNGHISEATVLRCSDFASLDDAIHSFLNTAAPNGGIRHAAIAIANPVDGDQIRMTNHHWAFSIEATRRTLGFETLLVVNDFTALAMSLPHLKPDETRQIGEGAAQVPGVIGLVGAGTGLGVSGLIPTDDGWISLGSEGGHVSVAAMTAQEIQVLQHAQSVHGHVSAERLLSGPGLALIYQALSAGRSEGEHSLTPEAITHEATSAKQALQQSNPASATGLRALQTIEIFTGLLGGMMGNVALTLGALGGLYIGGGIVPKLDRLDLFDEHLFRQRFVAKGRFNDYLSRIPTTLITADHPAFLGVSAILSDELRRRSGESQLLDRIRQIQSSLSQAERRVAQTVLESTRVIVNAPVAEIARMAKVSEPTVIRFCRTLGFNGLPDFKLKLAIGLTHSKTIPVSFSEVELGDSAVEFGAKVMDNTISALLQARENLNVKSLETAITWLQSAKRVDIYAVGQWTGVAHDAQSKLLRLGIPTLAHTDPYLQKYTLAQLDAGSVVLVISRTGTARELLAIVEHARKAGARVIALSNANSPLARAADIALQTDPHLETSDTQMPMISRIVHLALVDILTVGVSLRLHQSGNLPHSQHGGPRLPLAHSIHLGPQTQGKALLNDSE